MTILDFDKQTEDQKLRDERFAELVKEQVIAPLLEEVESLVHGYASLSDTEKVASILKLNEQYAPEGHMLPMEFGTVNKIGIGYQCAMFSGKPQQFRTFDFHSVKDAPTVYSPEYVFNYGSLGTHWLNETGDGTSHGLMTYILHSERYDTDFWSLPIAYRFALIAHALRESVFCTLADACRFAIGIDENLTLRRWNAEEVISNDGQVFGWNIEVRDSMPPVELMKHIARIIKQRTAYVYDTLIASEYSISDSSGDVDTELGKQPVFGDAKPYRRGPRESTRILLEFLDKYLPSTGRYVGTSNRHDGCKRMSWSDAYDLFNEKYPNVYSSVESMKGSYQNAKAKRKAQQQ